MFNLQVTCVPYSMSWIGCGAQPKEGTSWKSYTTKEEEMHLRMVLQHVMQRGPQPPSAHAVDDAQRHAGRRLADGVVHCRLRLPLYRQVLFHSSRDDVLGCPPRVMPGGAPSANRTRKQLSEIAFAAQYECPATSAASRQCECAPWER